MIQMCPNSAACRFYMKNVPGSARAQALFRKRYCMRDGEGCARKRVRLGLGINHLPDDMYPSDHRWADEIFADAERRARVAVSRSAAPPKAQRCACRKKAAFWPKRFERKPGDRCSVFGFAKHRKLTPQKLDRTPRLWCVIQTPGYPFRQAA